MWRSAPRLRLRLGPRHLLPQGRLRQIQLAGHDPRRLALVQDESHRYRLELIRELAPCPAPSVPGHAGHRIRLSEDVHKTGARPSRPKYLGRSVKCGREDPHDARPFAGGDLVGDAAWMTHAKDTRRWMAKIDDSDRLRLKY